MPEPKKKGGRRPGAGRPKGSGKANPATKAVRVSPDTHAAASAYAGEHGLTLGETFALAIGRLPAPKKGSK